MRNALLFSTICLLIAISTALADDNTDDSWVSLFDGKTLTGWKANERPDNWTVKDGAIVGNGERSHLYYMKEQFKDFELKAEVMINEGGNSGIYFHIEYHEDGWFYDGHEAQINNTHGDPVKTGSLWAVVKLYESNAEDDEWFPMHITVKDQNIVVRVNGKVVVDYTEPEGANGPRRLSQGYLALQAHDPGSTVKFRDIKFRKLSPAKQLSHAAKTPDIDSNWTWIETPFNEPVIDRGLAGSWDHAAVDNPYVYVEDGRYYCFFEAQDRKQDGWHERIGLAVSDDGVNWTKHENNPVIDIGPSRAWDGVVAKLPAGIIKHDGKYFLFYSGRDNPNLEQTSKGIGVATADDLEGEWHKHSGNPILSGHDNYWDRHVTTLPAAVFERDGSYWMLYRGMKGFYHHQGLGAASSDDLLKWQRITQVTSRPLIPTDQEVASFAVALSCGKYVAISQPLKLADRRYWYSDNLLVWTKGPRVKFETSVEAETISNPFLVGGRWNVLYEQGDRIFRAVLTPPNHSDANRTNKER